MSHEAVKSFSEYFKSLKDPRRETLNKRHNFLDILIIAICAMICGANNFVEIEQFGHSKKEWFQTFLELPNGIPSHDTFNNVLSKLSPNEFEACFMTWANSFRLFFSGEHIAIDGKTLRGSADKKNGKSPLHLVSAWATETALVIGQIKTEEKSNEITAIPELLNFLDLKGCLVSIDAMGCQTEIAEKIVEKDADYVLALKGNQPKLHQSVIEYFKLAADNEGEGYEIDFAKTDETSYGREEIRCAYATNEIEKIIANDEWKNIKTVAMIESQRIKKEKEFDIRYYISSAKLSAEDCLKVVRKHWEIENKLHWTLDVAFREDESRIRQRNTAENMAILRRIALNLVKQEKTAKVGQATKRLMAGWDEKYLLKLLNGLAT